MQSLYLGDFSKSFSHIQLVVTPWTVAHQAALSMGFSGWILYHLSHQGSPVRRLLP